MDGSWIQPRVMQTCRVLSPVMDQLHQECMSWLQLSVNHARLLSLYDELLYSEWVQHGRTMRHAVHNCKDSFRWVLHTFIVLPYSSPCRLQADMHGAGMENTVSVVWREGEITSGQTRVRRLFYEKLCQMKWKQMCASKSSRGLHGRRRAFYGVRSFASDQRSCRQRRDCYRSRHGVTSILVQSSNFVHYSRLFTKCTYAPLLTTKLLIISPSFTRTCATGAETTAPQICRLPPPPQQHHFTPSSSKWIILL